MTTQIKLKKSSVSGNIPDSGDLQYGELAINFADGKLFYKNSSNEIKAFIDSAAVQSLITTYQGLDSAGVTNLVDSAYVQARQTFSTFDSGSVTNLVDSAYVQARQIGAGFALYEYNATAGQSTFEDSDLNGDILSYDENNIMVHYNGILLSKTEYTATDGTSVVLDDPADSGSIIMIAKWLEGGQDTLASSSSASSFSWGGDRALSTDENSLQIDYFDMTTTTNAADFGDLTQNWDGINASFSDASRGVMHNGNSSVPVTTNLEYVTISTTGNATNFGDGVSNTTNTTGASDGTYGIIAGGFTYGSPNLTVNQIAYVTIQTTGNAADFGDTTAALSSRGGISNSTYGVFGGGYSYDGSTSTNSNIIDYITIASTGNATDFGDISTARRALTGCEDDTRGVFAGGETGISNPSDYYNTLEYITVASPGNATDFGDLTAGKGNLGAAGNGTRGVIVGGIEYPWATIVNTVEYITIQTTGNATDLLDLTQAASRPACFSGNAS